MKLSIEDELIYIYLTEDGKLVATIPNVNGYLIHDKHGNWIGFQVEKSQYENRQPIELPPFNQSDFTYKESEEHITLFFQAPVGELYYYEQECNLDIWNKKVVGIEIIRYSTNPKGKQKWISPFLI